MLSTDVSNKSQATTQHINYSPALINRPASTFPALYMIQRTVAPGQPLSCSASSRGERLLPIWQEINVQWKAGATPVLLVKDDQIKELASQGQLTMTATPIVLDCPIVTVG